MHPQSTALTLTPEQRAALLAPIAARGRPRPAQDACLALSYARVSKSVQTSIPDQHAAILRDATSHGVPIGLELDDEGSRWDNDREGYVRLKREAASGHYSHVWLFKADRLGGDDVEFISTVRYLLRLGLVVMDTKVGQIDDNIVGFLGLLSHMEIKACSERTINVNERKAAAGVKLGVPPLGYKVACALPRCKCGRHGKFVPGEHAEHVTELFRRYADGEALGRLLTWFNTATGLRKTTHRLRVLLAEPYYYGLIVNNRERKSKVLGCYSRPREEWTVSDQLHDHPLIDKDTFDRCQARLASQPHKGAHFAQHTGYGLSGLVWCVQCDRRMVAHRAHNVEWRCPLCLSTRGYAKLERTVRSCMDKIPVPADSAAAAAAMASDAERDRLTAQVAEIDARVVRLSRRRVDLVIREADAEDDQERSDLRAAYRATDGERAELAREREAIIARLGTLPATGALVTTVLERLQGCEHWTDLLDGKALGDVQELYRQTISRVLVNRPAETLTVEYTPPVARWYGRTSDTVPLPSQKAK